jgi:hypothetical protein
MKRLLTLSLVALLASGVCMADDTAEDKHLESRLAQAKQEYVQQLSDFHEEDDRHRAEKASMLYQMALASNINESDTGQETYRHAKELYEKSAEGAHQRRRHLDQLRMLKLLQLLDLREDQEVEFMHSFSTLRRQQRDVQEERKEEIDRLAALLKEGSPTLGEVDRAIDHLRALEDRRSVAQDRFVAKAHEILTAGQLGHLVVFQDRFEKEMLGNLREFQYRRQSEIEARGQYRELRNGTKSEKRTRARR